MKRILVAALVIASLPVAAQAADLSYTYLQGGYGFGSADSGRDSHSWSADGSVAVGQNFQVLGGLAHTRRSAYDNHPDLTTNAWNLGAGFHAGISDRTDFVADVAYHHANVDGASNDAKHYSGEIGVRSALAPKFEGWAMAGYGDSRNSNTGNSHGEVFGKLGAQYKFNKNWGLVAEGRASHNSDSIFVGPRISF